MESLRIVISRLFADAQDMTSMSVEDMNQTHCGFFSRKPPKRRRLNILHPETTEATIDRLSMYDNSMITFPLQTSRIDYDALVLDFLRACVVGNMVDQLKVIMLKYREPPLTLAKTTRLLAFLHHLLKVVPIDPKANTGRNVVSLPTTVAQHQQPFPLAQVFEDLTLTLSLRPNPQHNPSALSIWIVTIQFMISCLRSSSYQALSNAGITTPVILGIIKHVLLELTHLPATDMDLLEKQCFAVGKQMLDLFLIRDPSSSASENGVEHHDGTTTTTTSSQVSMPPSSGWTVSFYDVVYSFPELYGHFLSSSSTSAHAQPSIANHNVWLMTLHYMITSITQDHRLLDRIPTLMAVNIIKHMLREINTLPPNLSTAEVDCLNKGKELINLLLLGPTGNGAGVVSHYDIIVVLPDVYGHFVRGTFAQSIHWTMEKFINELGKRRRHLAFLMMPPDASWPLISQLSRRHEYNDLTTRTSYHMFEGDLIEFVKEGNSTNIETHFRDMLFQRASMDEFRQLVLSLTQTGLDTSQIRKAMVAKVRDVIQCIQQHSRQQRRPGADKPAETLDLSGPPRKEDVKMLIPQNMDLWELMIETADQLYSFVAAEFFSYEDIIQEFYDLVYQPNGEEYPPGAKYHLKKDNGLVWLLLQLICIDKVSNTVIQRDFEGDERLFGKLVALYNEEQILSEDAFSLRDLSLQCAINHQKASIKDISNIKQRHWRIGASLQHAAVCYQVQAYFSNQYQSKVTDPTLFRDLDMQEMVKVAMQSQMRQDVVPYTLYMYLVPNKADVGTLGNPESTYAKGVRVSYKLLDLLSISAKHRLLQLIYKMMLDSEVGPRYQGDTQRKFTCVPPYVLDAVYKLLYSAPCSAELMIKEIFDKLRRCDKCYKMKYAVEQPGNDTSPLPVTTMRWLHTILQLMNYRFVRYLKFSSISSGIFHYIRYSISYLEHRQVYRVLESFVFNMTRMQMDVKLLRSLDDPNREKPIWFGESETVARAMVTSISRLIKTRGQADIKTEQIHRVLGSLFEYKIDWSPESLKYFPEPVRSFYEDPQSPNNQFPERPTISPMKIQQLLSTNKAFPAYLLQGSAEHEQAMVQHFSQIENQSSLLCIIWLIAAMRGSMDGFHMASVRKLLLLIRPSRADTHAVDLIDFILNVDYPAQNPNLPFELLDTMIWKHQWINFTHVISALVKGSGSPERTAKAFRYVQYLLLESPEFSNRARKWDSLGFSPRYWTEEDFHDKLMQYLQEFPEYHEYEGFFVQQQKSSEQSSSPPVLDPPLQPQLPIYFTNIVSDFVPFLEVLIARLIEYGQSDLLLAILDRYGHLFYYHNCPLSYVCNLLLYYYPNDTLSDPRICKRILRLLDFEQYNLAPEAIAYAKDDDMDGSMFDAAYFERVIHKLTGNLNPRKCAPRANPRLPERHFREITSPAVEGITIAMLEIILTPVKPSTIVKSILDLVLQRGQQQVGVSALTIHATGLLLSSLPSDHFVRPIWDELSNLITHSPYLLEVSEPCQLIRCGMPRRTNGKYFMSQSLPDLTDTTILKDSMSSRLRKAMVFPYIFNDYTFNLHNYSTNAPNCFLTLFHSLLHYSSLDAFPVFLEYLRALRQGDKLKSDVQLLYVCFLLGPALHRIEKLDNNNTDAEYLIELMHMVKQVTALMDMKDGWSTQALEQVFDFLHHIRASFLKSTELTNQLRDIIKTMNPPISQRLNRLLS